MSPLDIVELTRLMDRSGGRQEIAIGLIDGPVAMDHPDLSRQHIQQVTGRQSAACTLVASVACSHGTYVAGILSAKRGSAAPGICPDCTLLVRPIFPEHRSADGAMPTATPEELTEAIVESIDAGARLLNMSAALLQTSSRGERAIGQALDYAAHRGVIAVAAAGNQGMIGSSVVTRHPWVIPVAGCDRHGRPMSLSNLGSSIGRRGLRAPGESITSLGTDGKPLTSSGTSAASPFVTGAIALLWSEFPAASAAEVKLAITRGGRRPRNTLVPPLMDAWAAYQLMASAHHRGTVS
jgi:subtilisin family serine protease